VTFNAWQFPQKLDDKMLDKPKQTVYNNRYIRYYSVYWKHRHIDLIPAYCRTQAVAIPVKRYGGVF